jgi:chromate transporter
MSEPDRNPAARVDIATVAREWTRIGITGFGGPPTHIALLRRLCVSERGWIGEHEFEDALAACNLMPGPASTQLAIYCAGRVGGRRGAIVGGLGFILPGLGIILVLAWLLLSGSAPDWLRALAAGAGAAVPAVALRAGSDLIPASLRTAGSGVARLRWGAYLVAGGVAAAVIGPWLVAVLVACGAIELVITAPTRRAGLAPIVVAGHGGWPALIWSALKVGALSFGGGFVIIPLMQSDAVHHHWLTSARFLDAVALGQITPGPVVLTVAVVGYAAAGVVGGVVAAVVAFAPSFAIVLIGSRHFGRIRGHPIARAFLRGAGPAAIGAILGSVFLLAGALSELWQATVMIAAGVALVALRQGIVAVILSAAAIGVAALWIGLPMPH